MAARREAATFVDSESQRLAQDSGKGRERKLSYESSYGYRLYSCLRNAGSRVHSTLCAASSVVRGGSAGAQHADPEAIALHNIEGQANSAVARASTEDRSRVEQHSHQHHQATLMVHGIDHYNLLFSGRHDAPEIYAALQWVYRSGTADARRDALAAAHQTDINSGNRRDLLGGYASEPEICNAINRVYMGAYMEVSDSAFRYALGVASRPNPVLVAQAQYSIESRAVTSGAFC